MLDDFRQQANTSPFFGEEDNPPPPESDRQVKQEFLGMTPFQRFVISVILLILTTVLGAIILLVTEKVVLPLAI